MPTPYEIAVRMASQGILMLDGQGKIVDANPAAQRLLGVEAGSNSGFVGDWLDGAEDLREAAGKVMIAKVSGEQLISAMPSRLHQKDAVFPLLVEPLAQASVERLVAFATLDPVTRLHNRDAFEEMLTDWASDSLRKEAPGVLVMHLDRFGLLADAQGHSVGDNLLRAVARELKAILSRESLVGRLHGAVFAVAATEIESQARRIQEMLDTPIVWGGRAFDMSASIGLIKLDGDGDAGKLLQAAELAARMARQDGGGRTHVHTRLMQQQFQQTLELAHDLKQALKQGEFSLHYQPKVRWPERHLTGVEALLRWSHPTRGSVPPGRFISIAEQYGMIVPLGNWVIREACRQLSVWRDAGICPCPVAVNVSPRQLLEQDVDELLAPLSEFSVPRELLEIEITETAMMDALELKQDLLKQLRASGIKISIDDFGTGHSSLSSLRRLPISVFKIDKSFVDDITTSDDAREIVTTIIAMANSMSLQIVAEGVETEAQAKLLAAKGAKVMQGYFFSRPLPADKIVDWFQARNG